jgi:hypothetical protein
VYAILWQAKQAINAESILLLQKGREQTMSPTRDPSTLQKAIQSKQEFLNQVFGVLPQTFGPQPGPLSVIPPTSNVVGVGYGAKVTSGATVEGEEAIRVYVRTKEPMKDVPSGEKVPTAIQGVPTDVIPVGDITAYVSCGVSVGHFRITAGTLGCLVEKIGNPGTRYILSNNHVLADSNAGAIGDDIFHPGPLDGGVAPAVATLTDFKIMDFLPPAGTGTLNDMDAAIAELTPTGTTIPPIPPPFTPDILNIGRVVNPPVTAALYQSVRKHGRTTRHTIGVIMDISATIRVLYGSNRAEFDDQLAIVGAGGMFSAGGDSGSLIVDAVTLRPVGLLFAGGGSTTFANPIDVVLSHFGITIL